MTSPKLWFALAAAGGAAALGWYVWKTKTGKKVTKTDEIPKQDPNNSQNSEKPNELVESSANQNAVGVTPVSPSTTETVVAEVPLSAVPVQEASPTSDVRVTDVKPKAKRFDRKTCQINGADSPPENSRSFALVVGKYSGGVKNVDYLTIHDGIFAAENAINGEEDRQIFLEIGKQIDAQCQKVKAEDGTMKLFLVVNGDALFFSDQSFNDTKGDINQKIRNALTSFNVDKRDKFLYRNRASQNKHQHRPATSQSKSTPGRQKSSASAIK